MNWQQAIEQRAAEAMAEIKRLANAAREQIDRDFAFLNRSRGQKKRWANQRQKGKS